MPILKQSIVWFDCKLEGHLSPDADCRLYLGQVIAAHICDPKHASLLSREVIVPPVNKRRKSPRSQATAIAKQFKQ
jgi:flavin reductase (DIM6/NTAB) family NADH-FMN oxidoreductase RutF